MNATCIVLLACILLSSPSTGWSQGLEKLMSKAPPKEDTIPPNLSPEGVDNYLAGMSDQQARRLLAAELKEKAAAKSGNEQPKGQVGTKDTGLALAFFAAQAALSNLSRQVAGIIARVSSADTGVWEKLVGGTGPDRFLTAVALLVLIILLGLATELLLRRTIEKIRSRMLKEIPQGGWEKAGILLSKMTVEALGLGAFGLFTFLAYFIIYGQRQPAYLVSSFIILSYYFRLVEATVRLIVSPKDPKLRLVPMSDSDARLLYHCIIWVTVSVIPGSALAMALQKSGANRELFLFVYSTTGPIVSILLAVMIWLIRNRVASFICPLEEMEPNSTERLRQGCANYWHYPAILFALAVGGYWGVRVLTDADASILRLILSLFLVPVFIAADQWLLQMFGRLSGRPQEVIDFSTPGEGVETGPEKVMGRSSDLRGTTGKDMSIYFPLIRKIFRMVLLGFLFFAALELWGIGFDIGWILARSVLSVIIALVLGFIAWEVVKVRVDQRIKEEMPFQGEEAEEGGSGGSRSGTLLLLLRKFIMVFLFVVVGFSILASLGVNIAPLLAGAGVIGLAIGFGSQALVKDIISGIFFLIDDAFRVGDYVEAGTAKGTVEHISLRSLRLRHPRGQVFVVPFGDLSGVQNFTRDYIIEKLDIRVRFDTDPDVIRKIIKRINKEIKADEELAKFLLSDIKSVGVREMDDSAMIMRVKFRCIPGEQFVLRRHVFHRIQKAFKEKGIEFAHRNVTVYLPPQPGSAAGSGPAEGGQSVPPEAAGAAAAAAIAQSEAEALAKETGKKKSE